MLLWSTHKLIQEMDQLKCGRLVCSLFQRLVRSPKEKEIHDGQEDHQESGHRGETEYDQEDL